MSFKKQAPAQSVAPQAPSPTPVKPDLWWVKDAQEELGVKEIAGAKDNPRIVHFHSFTSLKATDDETPWCSSFMCFIFGGGTKSAAAKSWATWGQHLDRFIPGCICVYKRDGGHHVHIGMEDLGDYIRGLGGNQGNAVTLAKYPRSKLIAMRWPPGVPIPQA